MHVKYLFWAVLLAGCDSGSVSIVEDDTDTDDDECPCDNPDCECDDATKDCTRIMSYTITRDEQQGNMEGTWNAGKHGKGWFDASWQGKEDQASISGIWGWGIDDYTDEGELEGRMWEEDELIQLEGWAWTSNTQAYFRSSHGLDSELGEGWWSFAEASMQAVSSQDESKGSFKGTWADSVGQGIVSGSWGADDNDIGGWVTAKYTDSVGDMFNLHGSWETGEQGVHSWHGELSQWGYWFGTSEPMQGGRSMQGIGHPFGCDDS
ncbi:MAG: hypothetical protein HN348_03485 [Proteobacteria bacterium]|nr:hypothetical protein [Pseudomonadota bacterium]